MAVVEMVAGGAALAYLVVMLYAMGARLYDRSHLGRVPPPTPPILPAEADWLEFVVERTAALPRHPHSNLGWDSEPTHILCAASDVTGWDMPEGAEVSHYFCMDCKKLRDRVRNEFDRDVNARVVLAVEYLEALERWRTDVVGGDRRKRSPWLWPLWVLKRPLEMLGPNHARREVAARELEEWRALTDPALDR